MSSLNKTEERKGPGRVRFSVGRVSREVAFRHHVRWSSGWIAVDGVIFATWDPAIDHITLAFLE